MKHPLAIHLHLFSLLSLSGMALWIIKDLWVVILVAGILAGALLFALPRRRR